MVIRGAPAIGVAAAMGIALGMRRSKATGTKQFATEFQKLCDLMAATRPTAVNLFWAIERMKRVFADETRPFLQGARLTAWELVREGISTTVITESMAGPLMRGGEIDLVVVGADRIAANGDTANKIGTYTVAVLAHEHSIPFYVAAPLSTIDLSTPDGDHIPIEERDQREVTHLGASRLTPEGAKIRNPAFDITPYRYIAGVITERGIFRPPYSESLKQAFAGLATSA
ncbi:MAG: hypothetical protein DMF85_09535 [Acidobacteria bacterium]|nr:MAG: hypothetical protein DMF85_09535 [Acidobacteriota bacterium]